MTEQLISFETAKLAKEKKFNIKTWFTWIIHHAGETLWEDFEVCQWGQIKYPENHNDYIYRYSAPAQSLLQKWLREKYSINISITTTPSFEKMKSHKNKYKAEIEILFRPFAWLGGKYYLDDTYEKVLTQALQEALKSIDEDKNENC